MSCIQNSIFMNSAIERRANENMLLIFSFTRSRIWRVFLLLPDGVRQELEAFESKAPFEWSTQSPPPMDSKAEFIRIQVFYEGETPVIPEHAWRWIPDSGEVSILTNSGVKLIGDAREWIELLPTYEEVMEQRVDDAQKCTVYSKEKLAFARFDKATDPARMRGVDAGAPVTSLTALSDYLFKRAIFRVGDALRGKPFAGTQDDAAYYQAHGETVGNYVESKLDQFFEVHNHYSFIDRAFHLFSLGKLAMTPPSHGGGKGKIPTRTEAQGVPNGGLFICFAEFAIYMARMGPENKRAKWLELFRIFVRGLEHFAALFWMGRDRHRSAYSISHIGANHDAVKRGKSTLDWYKGLDLLVPTAVSALIRRYTRHCVHLFGEDSPGWSTAGGALPTTPELQLPGSP